MEYGKLNRKYKYGGPGVSELHGVFNRCKWFKLQDKNAKFQFDPTHGQNDLQTTGISDSAIIFCENNLFQDCIFFRILKCVHQTSLQ